jgi:hypothetical protein
MESASGYIIIDGHTGNQIGRVYLSLSKAHNRADALDLEYGAVRYGVKRITEAQAQPVTAWGK